MMNNYPSVKTLHLVNINGSNVSGDNDSDMALDLGRMIYQKG